MFGRMRVGPAIGSALDIFRDFEIDLGSMNVRVFMGGKVAICGQKF